MFGGGYVKFDSLIREVLKEFKGYTSEIHTVKLTEELGVSEERILKLDGNENLFIDQSWIKSLLKKAVEDAYVSLYTDTACSDLRETIAKFYGLKSTEVVVGGGADGVIDNIVKLFIDARSEGIVIEPTYSVYKLLIRTMGGYYKPILLDQEFNLNPEDVLSNISEETKIIFLCSPNNPTGNQFPLDNILHIIEESGRIVVIDEAYSDFGKYSILKLIRKYPNLIIVRTFSKAFGLASLRIGYALTNEELANLMLQVAFPYPVNIIGQKLIPYIFRNIDVVLDAVKKIREHRETLYQRLQEIKGIKPYMSDANFILFRIIKEGLNAKKVHRRLLDRGIIVRDRSSLPLLDNCLRVTVPPKDKMEVFLSALEDSLNLH